MKIHYIQNDPLAKLGYTEEWAREREHSLSCTRIFENEPLPSLTDFEMLIILGGRMGVYEEEEFPWLVLEKNFIRIAITQGKGVLGICLGAQLISGVLGGKVFPHTHNEIGWWPIELTSSAQESPLFKGIPKTITAFEYHGDTFELPQGAILLASSKGCKNQAFSYGERVLGLQFHPEFTGKMICGLKKKFGSQLPTGKYIQTPSNWIQQTGLLEDAKSVLFTLLNNLEAAIISKV